MNQSNTIPVVLMWLTTIFLAVEVCAQPTPGRGWRGQKQQNTSRSGNQQTKQALGQPQNARGTNNKQKSTSVSLTKLERENLILMREEEKLARDVYLAMHKKWGARVFGNISQAESRHMNAVASLLSRYRIADPVTDNTPGKFTATRFQQLYTTLVNTGSNSLQDALKVGLKIEEMDIADLRMAIQQTKNQDIKRVLEKLLRGSHNHLRAFSRQLAASGGTYNPTSLSQSDFDQIAGSSQERGGQNRGRSGQLGKGFGKGRGQGQGMGKKRGNGRG